MTFQVTDAMKAKGDRFIMKSGFSDVEDLRFGRLAFKGMNLEVEKIMLEEKSAIEEVEVGEPAKQKCSAAFFIARVYLMFTCSFMFNVFVNRANINFREVVS